MKKDYQKRWERENPERLLFGAARRRAYRDGMSFTITLRDIVIPKKCPVFGFVLKKGVGRGGQLPTSPTLDRINSTRGYVPGNVAVISWRANKIKADATLIELKSIVSYIRKSVRSQKRSQ